MMMDGSSSESDSLSSSSLPEVGSGLFWLAAGSGCRANDARGPPGPGAEEALRGLAGTGGIRLLLGGGVSFSVRCGCGCSGGYCQLSVVGPDSIASVKGVTRFLPAFCREIRHSRPCTSPTLCQIAVKKKGFSLQLPISLFIEIDVLVS